MILFQNIVDYTVKRVRAQTANLFTIANLSLGSMAILSVMQGQLRLAVVLICSAAVLDMLDGRVARKMNIESEFGKQLDSLCDLISFGAAPALLVYQASLFSFGFAGSTAAVLFIACGAIRLARFNISDQNGYFTGLPIPAAGGLLTASVLFMNVIPLPVFMFLILTLSVLMISPFQVKKL